MPDVYITRTSAFMPNEPVSNAEMTDFIGKIDGKPSRAATIVLRNNGIVQRYYALDRQGRMTHTNAQIAAEAVRGLTGDGVELKDLEVLACGTSSPDQFLPSHASQVHGELDHPIEIVSPAGSCCTGMQALKYAHMSVASGNSRNAVVVGSEAFSAMMVARNFEGETERSRQLEQDPIIGFEKEFLRWMLSDGAAAVLLEPQPRGEGSLRLDWVVNRSYANELDVCMYSGADKDAEGRTQGWKTFEPADLAGKSVFTIKQDVKLLGKNIHPVGVRFVRETLEAKGFDVADVDHMLVHISSMFFRDKVHDELYAQGIGVPMNKWFINLHTMGNVGAASIFIMLWDLMRQGKVTKGQKILLMVPESARFSYSVALLTAV